MKVRKSKISGALALALIGTPVIAQVWSDAQEVPWGSHSDWRITSHGKASFVCVKGKYDLSLNELWLKDDGVGRSTGIMASLLGETYTISAATVTAARYRVDDGEWHTLTRWQIYGNAGRNRNVAFTLEPAAVERLKAGRTVEFVASFEDGATRRTSVSLVGFTKAFNTLPPIHLCS